MWARKGFNADSIRDFSDPVEVRPHNVLGITYRVKIESLVNRDDNITAVRQRIVDQKSSAASSAHGEPRASAASSAASVQPSADGAVTKEAMVEMRKLARQAMVATTKNEKNATELMAAADDASDKVAVLIESMSAWLLRPEFQTVPLSISGPMKNLLDDVGNFKKQVDAIKAGSNLAGLDKTQLKQAIGTVTALPSLSTTRKHSARLHAEYFSCNNAAVDPAVDNVSTDNAVSASITGDGFVPIAVQER